MSAFGPKLLLAQTADISHGETVGFWQLYLNDPLWRSLMTSAFLEFSGAVKRSIAVRELAPAILTRQQGVASAANTSESLTNIINASLEAHP